MTRLHIDHVERNLPVLLVFGEKSFLLKQFIEESRNNFRVILVSPSEHKGTAENELYELKYEESSILPQLEETIEYALIYLENAKQKAYLEPLFKKLINDKTKVLLMANAYKLEELHGVLKDASQYKNVRLSVIGDILDRREMPKESPLTDLIHNITEKKEFKLTGDDLLPIYTITPTDAIYSINRLLFGRFKSDTLYYLYYQHPETLLAAIHLISRIDPDIQIHFNDNPTKPTDYPTRQQISQMAQQELGVNEAYIDDVPQGFEAGVGDLINQIVPVLTEEQSEEIIVKQPVKEKKKRVLPNVEKRHFSPFFTVVVLSVVLFFLSNALLFFAGLFFLKSSIANIEKQNIEQAKYDSTIAQKLLEITKPTIYMLAEATTILDKNGKVVDTYHLIEQTSALAQLTSTTVSKLVANSSIDSATSLQTLLAQATYLFQEGERIKVEQKNETLEKLLKPEYSKLLNISQVLPELLGYHAEKNYLLLFQNSGELRPTGGFIGSIGELKLNKGKIEDLQIQDVYDLDGQLKNHVEPPFIVRRYLQPHLFLRDSNFSLDFQEAATTAALLYNLESKKKPDGVIAIDFFVLQELMEATGPIKLEAYNTTIHKDNVFDLIQSQIEEDKFAGSTQKKDILTSLFAQIMLKFENDPRLWLKMGQKLPQLLEQKHILTSFGSSSIQSVFSANNYAGEISDKRVLGSRDISDYLYVNEANIGVNKVNVSIEREVEYEAVLTDTSFTSNATLKLKNNSGKDNYTAYLQFAVPRGSKLNYISINEKRQEIIDAVTNPRIYEARNFKKPTELEVETYEKNGLTYFAFITTVNQEQLSTIQISYANGAAKNITSKEKYSLLTIKQPGTPPYPFNATVFYPDNYTLADSGANSYGKNYATFNVDLTTDKEFELRLRKK